MLAIVCMTMRMNDSPTSYLNTKYAVNMYVVKISVYKYGL